MHSDQSLQEVRRKRQRWLRWRFRRHAEIDRVEVSWRALFQIRRRVSLGLDVCRPDHLAPPLDVVRDQLSKVGGRARKYFGAQVGKPSLYSGIGKRGVDLLVELVDDLWGRTLGRAGSDPGARLIAGHKIPDGWDVRQGVDACRGGHG